MNHLLTLIVLLPLAGFRAGHRPRAATGSASDSSPRVGCGLPIAAFFVTVDVLPGACRRQAARRSSRRLYTWAVDRRAARSRSRSISTASQR